MFDKNKFISEIQTQGCAVIADILDEGYMKKAKAELEKAIAKENKFHQGKKEAGYGMVLLCSLYDKVFTDLFDNKKLTEPFNAILGEGCIVYAYTSSSMPPSSSNYSQRIHVDCPRIIPNY